MGCAIWWMDSSKMRKEKKIRENTKGRGKPEYEVEAYGGTSGMVGIGVLGQIDRPRSRLV